MPLSRKDKLALVALAALTISVGLDALRPPSKQLSVRAFVASVEGYHRFLHPITGKYIRCRYQPTCSNYASQAVQEYGILKGGQMSLRRIFSCRSSVPKGTVDPVP